jgi:hypothetical protein
VNGNQEMNGIRIHRLKNKLGTKALPTAELELNGMRAWLVGEEGRGVPVISTILNVTRYYNIAGSVAGVGRALGVVRAFARVRRFPKMRGPDTTLSKIPLFNKTLAAMTLQYRADMLLAHLVAVLLGAIDTGMTAVDGVRTPLVPDTPEQAQLMLRILTAVAKAYTAKHIVWSMQECMESLGGVGYMENVENPELNLARSLRDSNVNPIWEGTTNVQSADLVRVIKGRQGAISVKTLDEWLAKSLDQAGNFSDEKARIRQAWDKLKTDLNRDTDELVARGREILWRHGDIVCATLLVVDAARDNDAVATECAQRFVKKATFGHRDEDVDWREEAEWDERIAYCGPTQSLDDVNERARL